MLQMELLQSCTKPSISSRMNHSYTINCKTKTTVSVNDMIYLGDFQGAVSLAVFRGPPLPVEFIYDVYVRD